MSDSFRAGKEEMKLGIKPAAEALGLTLQDLGRQVRQAFYGEEAQRIQRGRDDIRVMVRYPRDERRSLGDSENIRIRTPTAARCPSARSPSSSRDAASPRSAASTATAPSTLPPPSMPRRDVGRGRHRRPRRPHPPEVLARHPAVFYTFEGMMAEQRDVLGGLQRGFALLAVPLRSYVQPLIIMSAIPFGLIGAVWGHLFLGLDVSMMSMFGLVAVTGVVVNASLILVDFINRVRAAHAGVGRMAQQAGGSTTDRRAFATAGLALAVREAGVHRFPLLLLTSLTTFFGPRALMWNWSFAAAFLVPIAVSLGFGVLFATFISLILVPTSYMILDDVGRTLRGMFGRGESADAELPGRERISARVAAARVHPS